MSDRADLWSLREEAGAHRKARRYAEALPVFETIWGSEGRSAWDGWGYAFCLEKLGRTRAALDVCRAAYLLDAEHDLLRQLYARCIYMLEVRGDHDDLARLQRAAAGICRLVEQDDAYAPYYTNAVLNVVGALKSRRRYDDVLRWLERLDPHRLSGEAFTFEKDGRQKQTPSDVQRYWSYRCKALYETGQHAACRTGVSDALAALPAFVNDGDVWLHRLAVLCDAAEGKGEAAYRALKALTARKPSWFLEHDLAHLARDLGRPDDAWMHLLAALLDRAPASLRIGIFETASAWCEQEGDEAAARAHLAAVLAIREAEGWPVRGELLSRSAQMGVKAAPSVREALNALRPTWQKWQDQLTPRLNGTIERLLAEGTSGFVRTAAGESFYFRAADLWGAKPSAGLAVTFRTVDGFDRKKNRATTNAVDLRPCR